MILDRKKSKTEAKAFGYRGIEVGKLRFPPVLFEFAFLFPFSLTHRTLVRLSERRTKNSPKNPRGTASGSLFFCEGCVPHYFEKAPCLWSFGRNEKQKVYL